MLYSTHYSYSLRKTKTLNAENAPYCAGAAAGWQPCIVGQAPGDQG
jgi:hypothetical protein